MRISVLVAFPPVPFATAWAFPACSFARMRPGRIFPFQSRRLSSPISKIFCAPAEGPLLIACEAPMLLTSRMTRYEKPLTSRTSAARTHVTT